MRSAPPTGRPLGISSAVPGLLVTGLAVAIAMPLSTVTGVSPLVAALGIGVLCTNTGLLPASTQHGTRVASTRLLRLGIVLLGFRLSLAHVAALGLESIALVVGTVVITFFGTRWVARRLGLSDSLGLLVATGFSICGASAVAAVEGVAEAKEEEVAFAIGLVTLCGSLAIVVLPPLQAPLGLDAHAFGQLVGASVHDVAQVVATADRVGETALRSAVIVKLTRVLLLAPLVAGVGLERRRRRRERGRDRGTAGPPLVPAFVFAFIAAVAVTTTGALPDGWLRLADGSATLALTAALFGLGTGVRLSNLRSLSSRGLLLGLISWLLIAVTAYLGVLVTTS